MFDGLVVWWRRRRLMRAYTRIAETEMRKTVGFTPVMRAYSLLERDGWGHIEDGEWRWTDPRTVSRES